MTGYAKQQNRTLIAGFKRCMIMLAAVTCLPAAAQSLLWSEEFNAGPELDPNTWTAETGDGSQYDLIGWGNGEKQIYTGDAANVMVTNGNLVITAQRDGNDFTSARIKTQNKVTFQYGTVEARIKTPDLADGLWPAFWTLGNLWEQGERWPFSGEIDIMEMGNSSAIADGVINQRVGSARHSASAGSDSGYLTLSTNINDTFVIYRLEWTPTSLTTYIDDQEIWSDDITGIAEFQKPHFLILNLAVGGGYTGISNPAEITAPFPAEYIIDYVRIYDNGHTILGGSYSNALPVFTTNTIVTSNADENSAYSDTIYGSATDAEDDPLTYSKISGPGWLNIAGSGALSGTPGIADLGLNSWTVQVSDGINDPVTATLEITVNDVNDDPVFFLDTFTKPNADEDSPYNNSINGTASDVDVGDVLTYSKAAGPAWLNIATNGTLTGTPLNADVGLNSWTVQVDDGNGGTDTATLEFTVNNVNDAPVFTTDPIVGIDALEGSFYLRTIAASATDEDAGSTLSYSKVSGPAWLNVNANGSTVGVPASTDVGLNSWTVQVSDGIAPPVSATLQIAVYSITPPVIDLQVSGANFDIYWPSNYTTYNLYGNSNLTESATWTSVTNAPVIDGGNWKVTVPISEAQPFFRLQAP
jgi:beta-glucanase (GH16 family)